MMRNGFEKCWKSNIILAKKTQKSYCNFYLQTAISILILFLSKVDLTVSLWLKSYLKKGLEVLVKNK